MENEIKKTRIIYVKIVDEKLTTRWAPIPYEDFTEIEIDEKDFQNYNDTEGRAFKLVKGIAVKVNDVQICKQEMQKEFIVKQNLTAEIIKQDNITELKMKIAFLERASEDVVKIRSVATSNSVNMLKYYKNKLKELVIL